MPATLTESHARFAAQIDGILQEQMREPVAEERRPDPVEAALNALVTRAD